MLRLLSGLAILTAATILTPLPLAAKAGSQLPTVTSPSNANISDLSAAKQKRASKQASSKRHASKRHVNRRYAGKRYYRTQRAWRPGVFRSDPSFDPYGRPWRPNFYSNCYEDLGYGRFRSCDVF